jgi:hypothetical protein
VHTQAQRAIIHDSNGERTILPHGLLHPTDDLCTLPQVEQALKECPKRHTPPLLIGDLNINLCAPQDERDEQIVEVVEDVCGLTDLSKYFHQRSCSHMQGRWMWRMRRGRRWVPSQCEYFLGRVTDRRKFCSICLRHPFNHISDHQAIITIICVKSATKMTAYPKRMAKFQVNLLRRPLDELTTCFKELRLNVVTPPTQAQSRNQWISAPTWVLINKRAALRQPRETIAAGHPSHWKANTARLKGGCAKWTAVAAENI